MAGVTVAAQAMRSLTPGPSFGRTSPIQSPTLAHTSAAWMVRKVSNQATRPSGATSTSSPLPISASRRATAGWSALATAGSTSANASRAISRRLGLAAVLRSFRSTRPTFSKIAASRANQPATSKLGPNGTAPSSDTRPQVGRMPRMPQ